MIFCGVKASRKRESSTSIMIKSIMLYAYKIWRLIERAKRALEVTEMDAIR